MEIQTVSEKLGCPAGVLRQDWLPGCGWPLFQRSDMFCINTDTALLGEYMTIRPADTVLDIGCNNGALMLYAARFHPRALIGIDKLAEACVLARENLRLNGVDNARVICADVADFRQEEVDVIVCNPPYFPALPQPADESSFLDAARHEQSCTLPVLFAAGGRLLKDKGRMYMVHRASRLADIIVALHASPLKLRRLTPVYDRRRSQAKAVLMEIRKGGGGDVQLDDAVWI